MDRKKIIEGLEAMRAFFGFGLPSQTPVFEAYQNILTDALALLSEQNPVKPVRDKKTGRVWLCGNCGSYVGFEDHDEDDPNEFDKFCRECGHPVLWEGR